MITRRMDGWIQDVATALMAVAIVLACIYARRLCWRLFSDYFGVGVHDVHRAVVVSVMVVTLAYCAQWAQHQK